MTRMCKVLVILAKENGVDQGLLLHCAKNYVRNLVV